MTDRYVEYLRLDEIQRAPRNAKQHDRAGIRRSIEHHGIGELPLLDERTGRLVAGHGRLEDLVERHREGRPVPDGVKVADDGMWMMPVIRGWASHDDEHAEAYLVASNKLTMTGGWDDRELVELLGDLDSAGMLELTGFELDELEALERAIDQADDNIPYGDAEQENISRDSWGVYVEADSEERQEEILSELSAQGYTVRPA